MRIALVSDIHGNLSAFEAILSDLRETAPDVVFHGGDLADNGSAPAEIVDRVRSFGWPGVCGNTDEMLFRPDRFEVFASDRPQLAPIWSVLREMAAFTREALGEDRLAWLSRLPLVQFHEGLALTHATPDNPWVAPNVAASESDFNDAYEGLGRPLAVYGHIHRPFLRPLSRFTVANSGSVSLSLDGDPRAAYLIVDEGRPAIRRVEYDLDREAEGLQSSGIPHAAWVARNLRQASFVMPLESPMS